MPSDQDPADKRARRALYATPRLRDLDGVFLLQIESVFESIPPAAMGPSFHQNPESSRRVDPEKHRGASDA